MNKFDVTQASVGGWTGQSKARLFPTDFVGDAARGRGAPR